MTVHVRNKASYISFRPLHNNNLQWLRSTYFGERERREDNCEIRR